MPIIFRIIASLAGRTPALALSAFRWYAADVIADFILAARNPVQGEKTYLDTMRNLMTMPGFYRRAFLSMLKASVEEAVWTAFENYARRIKDSDPALNEVAGDVVST